MEETKLGSEYCVFHNMMIEKMEKQKHPIGKYTVPIGEKTVTLQALPKFQGDVENLQYGENLEIRNRAIAMYQNEEKFLTELWKLLDNTWKRYLAKETGIKDRLKSLGQQFGVDESRLVTIIAKVNLKLQHRYRGTYDPKILASKGNLVKMFKLVKHTNNLQGFGIFGRTFNWPKHLKITHSAPDTVDNMKKYSRLARKIAITEYGRPGPAVTIFGRRPAPFVSMPKVKILDKICVFINYDYFTHKPDMKVKQYKFTAKNLGPYANKAEAYEDFPKSTATNICYEQGQKTANIITIVDYTIEDAPVEMSTAELFKTLQWKKYAVKHEIGNDEEHLEWLLILMSLNITRSGNADKYIQAIRNVEPFVQNRDAAAMKWFCNLEMQYLISVNNALSEFGISIGIFVTSVAVHGNILRSVNAFKNEIPSFMAKYTPKELLSYKAEAQEIEESNKIEIGETVEFPIVIVTPAQGNEVQNTIENSEQNMHELIGKEIRNNLLHVTVIKKKLASEIEVKVDPRTKKRTEERKVQHMWEGLTSSDAIGTVIMHNELNKLGNPVILEDTVSASLTDKIYKLGTSVGECTADYSEASTDHEYRSSKTIAFFRGESAELKNSDNEMFITAALSRDIRPKHGDDPAVEKELENMIDIKMPKIEIAKYQTIEGEKCVYKGGPTAALLAEFCGRLAWTVKTTKQTETEVLKPSNVFGIRIFDNSEGTTSRDRVFQNRCPEFAHQNQNITREYLREKIEEKANTRLDGKLKHPDFRKHKDKNKYSKMTMSMEILLNGAQSCAGRIQQKRRFVNTNLYQTISRDLMHDKINDNFDKMQIEAKQNIDRAFDCNLRKIYKGQKQAMQDLLDTSPKKFQMVPKFILENEDFISKLGKVHSMKDYCKMVAKDFDTRYILTKVQMEIILEKFRKLHKNKLRRIIDELWESSIMYSIIKLDAREFPTETFEMMSLLLEKIGEKGW